MQTNFRSTFFISIFEKLRSRKPTSDHRLHDSLAAPSDPTAASFALSGPLSIHGHGASRSHQFHVIQITIKIRNRGGSRIKRNRGKMESPKTVWERGKVRYGILMAHANNVSITDFTHKLCEICNWDIIIMWHNYVNNVHTCGNFGTPRQYNTAFRIILKAVIFRVENERTQIFSFTENGLVGQK